MMRGSVCCACRERWKKVPEGKGMTMRLDARPPEVCRCGDLVPCPGSSSEEAGEFSRIESAVAVQVNGLKFSL